MLSPVLPRDAGHYVLVVSNSYGSASLGFSVRVTVAQPLSRIVPEGASVSFHLSTVWDPPCAWRKDAVLLPGQNRDTLELASARTNDAGTYLVSVFPATPDEYTADPAQLWVLQASPAQIVPAGDTARLGVTVWGPASDFTFQWRQGATALTDGGRVWGASTGCLTLSNVQPADAGAYSLLVSNARAWAVSPEMALWVGPAFDLAGCGWDRSGDGFRLRLIGLSARFGIVLERSPNLVSWQPCFTNPPAPGIVEFVDRTAPGTPQRFYRLRRLE